MTPVPLSLYFALLVRRRLAFPWGAGAGHWRWCWRLGGSHWLSHSIDWIQGTRKQQQKAEQVGWFVACFFKSHAAQQRHWFGQLAISHIKQQVVCPCSHTIKHGSKVKTKRLSFVASFLIHFEPRFEPLGWLCALYSSAAGRKNRSRGLFAAIPMTKIRAPLCRLEWRCAPRK